ncbi:MAG TPA: class I SAM-dependent methyltransferase [Actinomycetes bacterium]|nr:class I SAM-dependent methyltransferase [Actinomycetes bacterium]
MDIEAFLAELPRAFEGPPELGVPADGRFADLVEHVSGFTTPAELAVLSLAASLLPETEAYLEVGTFKGRSVCAVLPVAAKRRVVAVENFLEFGMLGTDAREELRANLERYAPEGSDFELLEGDCFEVLASPAAVGRPVGVYFYDGAHTGLAHWLALGVVEPLLADEALVLVDDASWPMVARATERYVRAHPDWSLLRTFEAAHDDDPRWANGLALLAYRRSGATAARLSPDVQVRRVFQVRVRGPATSLVWRALHRFPGLVPLAKRLVPKRSRSVGPGG